MPLMAVLFVLSIASTFGVVAIVERSETAQETLGAVLCPQGWTLSVGGASSARTTRIRRGISSGFSASCVSPNQESDYCETCALAVTSRFLLFVGWAGLTFLWALRKPPSARDHLAQLDTALGLGALSRAQYDELRREVLANPEMTRERFHEALGRARAR